MKVRKREWFTIAFFLQHGEEAIEGDEAADVDQYEKQEAFPVNRIRKNVGHGKLLKIELLDRWLVQRGCRTAE